MSMKPHTFIPGEPRRSSEVNENFDVLYQNANNHENNMPIDHLDNSITTSKILGQIDSSKIADEAIKDCHLEDSLEFTEEATLCPHLFFNNDFQFSYYCYIPSHTEEIKYMLLEDLAAGQSFKLRLKYWDDDLNNWVTLEDTAWRSSKLVPFSMSIPENFREKLCEAEPLWGDENLNKTASLIIFSSEVE